MRLRFTRSCLENLEPCDKGELFAWDSGLPGFGLRVGRRRKSWLVQYRDRSGRTRRLSLGSFPVTPLKEARARAIEVLAAVERGEDPAEKRAHERQTPTLETFAERYRTEYAEAHKRPHSVASEASLLRVHLLPALGAKRLDVIRSSDVARFHAALREKPYTANRCLALLHHVFRMAATWGVLPEKHRDPTRDVRAYREQARERFLSPNEAARLGEALRAEQAKAPLAVAALRLLALTGARANEIRALRWEEVDLEAACLRLPAERTKENRAKTVPLSAPALNVLTELPRLDDAFVFPGRRAGRPLSLQPAWERVRRSAKLEGFRLHDLRHSFATAGVGSGLGLPIIGSLLGHRRPNTTARYGHVADDPRRDAAERIGSRVAAALDGKPAAEVVPLRSGA